MIYFWLFHFVLAINSNICLLGTSYLQTLPSLLTWTTEWKVYWVRVSSSPGKPIYTPSLPWMSLRIDLSVSRAPPRPLLPVSWFWCYSVWPQQGQPDTGQSSPHPPIPPPFYPALEGHWLTFISADMTHAGVRRYLFGPVFHTEVKNVCVPLWSMNPQEGLGLGSGCDWLRSEKCFIFSRSRKKKNFQVLDAVDLKIHMSKQAAIVM